MRNYQRAAIGLAAIVLVLLCVRPAAAQSKSSQAMNWFNLGVSEKDLEKKIEAYTKAVELDPQFVEALFNLGLTYKRQKDFLRVEEFLRRAYQAMSDRTESTTRFKITYELAMASRKLGKNREAEEALRRAKVLAGDPAMRATVALETGRLFHEQGRLAEALTELRAGQNLSTALAGDFADLIQKIEGEAELQTLYDSAQRARAGADPRQAKALLEQIRAKDPGYRDVAAKIADLETALAQETQKQSSETLYLQAQKYAAESKWEMAIVAYESVAQQAGAYKDTPARLQEARRQLEKKLRNDNMEREYAAGMSALRSQDWARAILSFEKVLAEDRSFRDTRRRLAEAQNGFDRESTETIAARHYAEGVSAMSRNDFGRAQIAFEKLRAINPKYRNLETLMVEVERALAQNAPSIQAGANATAMLDSIYQAALAAVEKKDWMQARMAFEKIQILQPGYRDVVDRLAQARVNSEQAETPQALANQKQRSQDSGGAFNVGVTLAAMLVLPALGLAFFSPSMRAYYCTMRADYAGAAQIYENLLARNPKRIKLYPKLANLYLILGRMDDRALKVFKTILQLNLATPNLEKINTIVAQQFLTEGRTDSDAIEVLEEALKAEQSRKRP